MRLEVRGENAPRCQVCDSRQLLHEVGSGTELTASLRPILERMLVFGESQLMDIWKLEQDERAEATEAAVKDLVERVEELSPKQARRYRVFKRRWQAELQAQIEKAVLDLTDRTRFV